MVRRTEITRRELLLAVLAAVLLSVAMHWPLPLHLGETIPKDLGDPLPQSWQIAWGGHALANQPLEFFQSNQFYPVGDSLAFGDALIGYAPAGLIGSGPEDAVVRYDLLFLFAYALCFLGAYVLARELGVSPAGAAVAGAAFAFAPFRLEQDGHMQVISSGGIPLALALGVRGVRLQKPGWLLAGWAVAAWQLSLGFAIGLPFAYLIGLLCLVGLIVWWRRGRPPRGRRREDRQARRRMIAAGVGGALLFVVVVGLIARPYFRVADEHPEAKRPPSTVEAFSGPVSVFITAPEENSIWGGPTEEVREDLENIPEQTLFPGALILVLALIGLGSSSYPRWLRLALGAGVLIVSGLALGFQEDDGWLWPYRWIYDVLPGWEAIRTPGRLVTFSSLGLALLAAAGAESVLRAVRRWLAGRHRDVGWGGASIVTGAAAVLLVAAIAIEGRGLPLDPYDDQEQPSVPDPPASTADVAAPQIHLPAERPEDNRRYLLWSTDGFPEIVNGRASTEPDQVEDAIDTMEGFPDSASVAALDELDVRSVVLHLDRVAGTPQAEAAAASLEGLPLRRRRLSDSLIVFELRPGPEGKQGDGDQG